MCCQSEASLLLRHTWNLLVLVSRKDEAFFFLRMMHMSTFLVTESVSESGAMLEQAWKAPSRILKSPSALLRSSIHTKECKPSKEGLAQRSEIHATFRIDVCLLSKYRYSLRPEPSVETPEAVARISTGGREWCQQTLSRTWLPFELY